LCFATFVLLPETLALSGLVSGPYKEMHYSEIVRLQIFMQSSRTAAVAEKQS